MNCLCNSLFNSELNFSVKIEAACPERTVFFIFTRHIFKPMKKIISIVLFVYSYSFVNGASVDTINIYSKSMQKDLKCVVIKPAKYKKKKLRFPTLYLLHGYDGWYANWILRVPELKKYADEFEMLIICPDGDKAGWYFDSPFDPKNQYETYISKEVPAFIDSVYRTIASKDKRAITGLSMGGHGALFLSFRHPHIFSAAGSMSGVVDLSEVKNKYQLQKLIGDTLHYPENWKNYSVLKVVEKKTSPSAIIIDDGVSDNFIEGNRRLHQKLLQLKIPHEYIERPGNHSWEYWRYAVHFQLLFFSKYFNKNE